MDSSNIFLYIQKTFEAALAELTQNTQPWSRWKSTLGFPNAIILKKSTKMIIYTMIPSLVQPGRQQQGQGFPRGEFDIIIGAWADRVNGGIEEIAIFDGKMAEFFLTPAEWANHTFNVKTDQQHTGTTLYEQGVHVRTITGPNRILDNTEENEFRHEFTINFRS